MTPNSHLMLNGAPAHAPSSFQQPLQTPAKRWQRSKRRHSSSDGDRNSRVVNNNKTKGTVVQLMWWLRPVGTERKGREERMGKRYQRLGSIIKGHFQKKENSKEEVRGKTKLSSCRRNICRVNTIPAADQCILQFHLTGFVSSV